MAVYPDREAFIPYRRTDIIELCIEDGQLPPSDVQTFRQFGEILSAHYHFKFHKSLEQLKDNFAPFNPDADTKARVEPTLEQQAEMGSSLVADFKQILERANYIPLSKEALEKAFEETSLIELRTDVDFDEFELMHCYYRGDVEKTTVIQKFWRKTELSINVFERVVLLLKFKDADYFAAKKANLDQLDFTPGKMYVYLYKNIPKFDIELLFPNVKISMTWKDRLMLIVPAIGAAVPLMLKALPQLLIIVGVVLFITVGPSALESVNANEEDVRNIMPVLVALLSLAMTLGGFVFKQYTSYKNKRILFQKKVTDTLFFKNLDSNGGVFHALIDAAEEEESKEIILVYYHLLTSPRPLTAQELDDKIEQWMDQKFGTKIDFDIEGPLGNLQAIYGQTSNNRGMIRLLTYDKQKHCHVLPLDEAKEVIDYVWDNAFQYAN